MKLLSRISEPPFYTQLWDGEAQAHPSLGSLAYPLSGAWAWGNVLTAPGHRLLLLSPEDPGSTRLPSPHPNSFMISQKSEARSQRSWWGRGWAQRWKEHNWQDLPQARGQVGAEGYALPSLAQLSSANRGRYRERRKKMPPKSLPAAWALNIPLELQGAVSSVAASELSLQFQRLETQLHHAPPQNISVNWRGCLFRDLNFR